jgi:hypothetical protein
MLVTISDLHLTDGSNGIGLDPGALDMFAQRLADLAMRASWRTDGRYRPVDRIDLVLLGDVLDLVRSRRWLEGSVRPWSDLTSPQLLETTSLIVDDVLSHNDAALRTLRALGTEGIIRLPQTSHSGQPIAGSDGAPVPVIVHYMVGNTDWLLHVRGSGFDLLRQRVSHAMGLINEHKQPFPHDPTESDDLLDALRRHGTLARHGDVFDPLHCGDDRDSASLGDAITIELVQRFLMEVEEAYGDELEPAAMAAILELDHFRPVALAAVYLEGVLERTCSQPSLRKEIKRIWDSLAEGLLAMPQVHQRGLLTSLNLVDDLASALLFSRKVSLGWATNIRQWLSGLRGANDASYFQHALAEADYRNRRAKHIVYGHTHHAETIPLDASYADGYVLQQTYFNTGTWRRVYQQTHSIAGQHEFLASDTFSFLAFFQGDERGGRPYETWSGSLGAELALPITSQGMKPSPMELRPATMAVPAPHSGATLRSPHFAMPHAARTTPGRR